MMIGFCVPTLPVAQCKATGSPLYVSSFRGHSLSNPRTSHPCNSAPDRSACSVRRCMPHAVLDDSSRSAVEFPPGGDDVSQPPKDLAADLDATLRELSTKMSQLPVPSREEVSRATRLTAKESASMEFPSRKMNSAFQAHQDDSDETWTVEQRALYTLVKQYDDESSTEDFGFEDLDMWPKKSTKEDSEKACESRKSQADPRKIDARDTHQRLQALKRRRERVASERGEDAFQELRSLAGKGTEDDSSELEFLQKRDRNNARNLLGFSLRGTRIIDFSEQLSAPCQLTAGARSHFFEISSVPLMHRPLFGMQDAFKRQYNPPCPRCGRRTPIRELQNINSICNECYSRIYLQTSIGSGTSDPSLGYGPWAKKEMEEAEVNIAELAEKMARSLVEGGKPTSMADTGDEARPSDAATVRTETKSDQRSLDGGSDSGGNADMNGNNGYVKRGRPRSDGDWQVQASDRSMRTINPIRNLVQNIDVKPNPSKEEIRLSVGDPTVYGNLVVSQKAIDKFCEVIKSGKANGYSMSMGAEAAREAVAQRYTSEESPLTKEDVILASGTSGAVELAIGALANEGDNVLLPRPGFPLFRTIAEGYGIECRFYDTDPQNNWEINFGSLTSLVDEKTRAIIVNNPSNPCGSVYSATHIEDLLAVASALRLPIIADEVYADMVFSDQTFTPIGEASEDVPVLSVGGMSKQFVVPGWRLGWVLIHDRQKILQRGEIRTGLRQLTTRMLVPNTPVQHVLPTMLQLGMGNLMKILEANAEFTMQALEDAKGLRVIRPQGAMYAMVEVDTARLGLDDDMDFVKQLLVEEAVFVLPGQCFQARDFVRIVFSAPQHVLQEAFSRMKAFCKRRYK